MNWAHLVTLHAAMSALLALPPSMLDEIARWLAPAKPNGHDPHPPNGKDLDPPPIASRRPDPTPHAGKTRHGRSPAAAKTDERKLLDAMRHSPGSPAPQAGYRCRMSADRLWRAACERLAGRRAVEKDDDGRWRAVAEEARPARVEPRPPSPSL